MTRRTMYKITIHYVSPLPRVSDGDGFSGLELTRVKLHPRLLFIQMGNLSGLYQSQLSSIYFYWEECE